MTAARRRRAARQHRHGPSEWLGRLDEATITDAIEQGAISWSPFGSDTWPAPRPLVERAAVKMPEGGISSSGAEDDPRRAA